jgi:hypothetical protein
MPVITSNGSSKSQEQSLPNCVLEPMVATRYEDGRWSGAKALAKEKAADGRVDDEQEISGRWLSAEVLPDRVTFVVEGAGFLYNMVRIIAGALLEVGTGLRTEASVAQLLVAPDRQVGGATMPADGLIMHHVEYSKEHPNQRLYEPEAQEADQDAN